MMLESHLKNGDFFDVENHPMSRFVSISVDPIPGAAQGTPNYMIHGLLQLKGVEKPLAFPAQIGASLKADGAEVALANFDFDRTQWNVLYGSGRFYENLGKHLVSDLVTLDLKIVAR